MFGLSLVETIQGWAVFLVTIFPQFFLGLVIAGLTMKFSSKPNSYRSYATDTSAYHATQSPIKIADDYLERNRNSSLIGSLDPEIPYQEQYQASVAVPQQEEPLSLSQTAYSTPSEEDEEQIDAILGGVKNTVEEFELTEDDLEEHTVLSQTDIDIPDYPLHIEEPTGFEFQDFDPSMEDEYAYSESSFEEERVLSEKDYNYISKTFGKEVADKVTAVPGTPIHLNQTELMIGRVKEENGTKYLVFRENSCKLVGKAADKLPETGDITMVRGAFVSATAFSVTTFDILQTMCIQQEMKYNNESNFLEV